MLHEATIVMLNMQSPPNSCINRQQIVEPQQTMTSYSY